MKCKVSVKINQNIAQRISASILQATELTAEAILSDITARNVVPKMVGVLEDSGYVEEIKKNVFSIMYSTPYARRWYFNLPITDKNGKHYKPAVFQKTENPNAKDHWMDYYFDGEGKQWVTDTFIKFLKRESGGIIK